MNWTVARVLLGMAAVLAAEGSQCKDDFDCSLAGKCTADGACACKSWATGKDCAALNLVPPASAAEVKPLVQPHDNWTRWGGSPVHDPDTGLYHLFSAEMADKCSLNVWGTQSTVIHSTSTSATGPFTRVGLAIGAEAHNPVLSRATDGTWLIWTCGCPNPNPPSGSCTRTKLTCPGGQQAAWTTTVYSSTSLAGPWTPHVNALAGIGGMGMSQNVSPMMLKNGTVVLMFKGPDNNTEASLAVAPHWSGPYKLVSVNIFERYFAEGITNEDCWFWQDQSDGSYHMLSHRMTPNNRETTVTGGHGFALDLFDWHYAMTPAYTNNLTLADGTIAQLARRERPQLLLDPKTGTPVTLYNAVSFQGATFTYGAAFSQV